MPYPSLSIKTITTVCTALMVTLTLSGCSGEPSESDIKQAYKNTLKEVVTKKRGLSDVDFDEAWKKEGVDKKVDQIKKIKCEKDPTYDLYQCPIQMDTKTAEWKLVKTVDGWKLKGVKDVVDYMPVFDFELW